MKLVVATHNLKKAGEMLTLLKEGLPDIQLATLADYPLALEPEETGSTYRENATIKACAAIQATGEWCIADDAGLEIDALNGEPGLYSKRFGGEGTPFTEKMAIILDLMKDVPTERRTARFRCCVAFGKPGEPVRVIETTCVGRIAGEPSGNGGFGYDPIFFLPEKGCCMADLTADEKHAISHRGKALREFCAEFAAIPVRNVSP